MKHRARDVLAVLTSETMRDFVLEDGTSTLKLSPKSAKDCQYIVCEKIISKVVGKITGWGF